jgi:hypothetical protein
MPPILLPLNKGCATGIDPSLLEDGYLQEAEGVVYEPSDPAAHKMGGRVAFNSAISATALGGVGFVDFDTATDLLLTQTGGAFYSSTVAGAVFASIRSSLTSTVTYFDSVKFADQLVVCNGTDTNWVVKNDNTTIRLSLVAQTVAPTHTSAGAGITGTFEYWATEYDSTNDVESAFTGTPLTVTVTDDTVTITKPATVNSSATDWRLYRSKTLGEYPVGWRLATTAIGTTTYADSTADADLVALAPYDVVSINGALESANTAAPVFKSLTTFHGALLGLNSNNVHFSLAALPHYFPTNYAITVRPRFGGVARCVRTVGDVAVVLSDHDSFRVNYLPSEADSFFDAGVAQEHLSNFGTPSPQGAASFSGWGGREMLFYASASGPMLTDGESTDRAVKHIDWPTHVPISALDKCVVMDNPDAWRIEMYFQSDASDTTIWSRLDFYYDPMRVDRDFGFPTLAWTGPHRVPGPGVFAVVSNAGRVYTGTKAATGIVYLEDSGTEDAADLIDSSGTVNWRLRTKRVHPAGTGGDSRVARGYVHKHTAGSGNYAATLTAWDEDDGSTPQSRNISATQAGTTSEAFSHRGEGFDLRLTFDGTTAMPAVNQITIIVEDADEEKS